MRVQHVWFKSTSEGVIVPNDIQSNTKTSTRAGGGGGSVTSGLLKIQLNEDFQTVKYDTVCL